jgi:glycosyltransferase involved in cell wall biosynthesis
LSEPLPELERAAPSVDEPLPGTGLGGDILYVTRKWAPAMGGMETYSVKLTEQFARMHTVEVIALPGRADGLPPRAASLLRFPFTALARYLRRGRPPGVLHLGDMAVWPLGLLARLRRGNTRVVVSAHGTDVSYPRRGGVRGRLYGVYLRMGARLLSEARVIANSRSTADAAWENGWRDIAIVPLATDMPAAETDGTHDGAILFAGRLIKRKGCAWFVREVLPGLPSDLVLEVAGTVWDEQERSVLEDPRVEFLGNLDAAALRQAYARALCVILPNIPMANGQFEGFGLVAAEAAAAGGLVLAADHSGLREAVIDGETGFLITAGGAAAWQRKILEVSHWSVDQRRRFLESAMRKAREQYSWKRVAADTVAAYCRPVAAR